MDKVVIVRVDGTVEEREQATPPELSEMQDLVEGYVEILSWPTKHIPYEGEAAQYFVNEEGLLQGLKANKKASELTSLNDWNIGPDLVGTLVILTGAARWD